MREAFARRRAEKRATGRLLVLTVSQYLRDQMLRAGYDGQRVHALPLPAPPAVAEPTPPPRGSEERFVFLGRLTPHKGVDWLLEAQARVQRPIHLDIAGDGNAQDRLRDHAKRLGLESRVHFHGWVDSEAVARLLEGARALVFPSLWQEPAGLVCFEAAAHARAVIASRVGGIPEMVCDQKTGLLVEPGNVWALAAAIGRLAGDADLAQSLGQRACQWVQGQFPMAEHLQKLNHFYRQCISSKG
jgi:glycosyltransferase involved in cell wall biosynthesis